NLQKASLHSRSDRADGLHRRGIADDYHSYRVLYRRCADAANVSKAGVLWGRRPAWLSGFNFAGARTRTCAQRPYGYRPRGIGDFGGIGFDGRLGTDRCDAGAGYRPDSQAGGAANSRTGNHSAALDVDHRCDGYLRGLGRLNVAFQPAVSYVHKLGERWN